MFLPGWAIPSAHYMPMLDAIKTKVRSQIFDYGFFPAVKGNEQDICLPAIAASSAPLIIVAHSMGSLFAFKLANANPAVKAVVLFSGFARFSAGGALPGRSIEDIDSMRKHLAENPEALLKSFYRASATPEQLKIQPPQLLNSKSLMSGLEILASEDVSSFMPGLKAPCLNIIAEGDMIVDAPMSAALASLAPSIKMKSFPAAGHLFPITKPEEAAKAIDEFLSENLPEGIG